MTNNKDQVTTGQLASLITQTQIGVGLLGLTYQIHSTSKSDSWISVLIAGILTQFFIFIMWSLSKRFPSLTLFDYLPSLFGKYIGKLLHFVYCVYFILVPCFIIVQLGKTVHDWVLFDTPRWIIMGIALAISLYLVRENLQTIARFFVLIFFCNIAVIVIAASAFPNVNLLYLMPVGQAGIANILAGAHKAMNAFSGYELLLICYPFVGGSSITKFKAATYANSFTTLLYTFTVFTSLIVFSPAELKLVPQPLLYMVKALSFSIFERADLYFISLWTVAVTTSLTGYLYMASKSIATLFHSQSNHRSAAPFVALLILGIVLIFRDQFLIEQLRKILWVTNYMTVFGIPLILLMISILFNIKETRGITR
ncbi:spore gernimation protein [Paenibacillus albiflavus]|uniref:Spore gernimation protein n=1 Tax=Paenibacillus albiflavus TaxID=2545760 RepID=A0A4R4EBA2_9BACL|nr:GerAB/ArcD/ProY family transporter [Paenibacillus albiflavus]TCZ75188.1 spore gernimation protein [Paenibacillus albiflavus]